MSEQFAIFISDDAPMLQLEPSSERAILPKSFPKHKEVESLTIQRTERPNSHNWKIPHKQAKTYETKIKGGKKQ